jgi:two-component system chemotaxis response regulator CheY
MSKTILVVEDSISFRQVVRGTLEKAGYTVIEAGDGRDACAVLDGRKIDMIVSDINMPHMDGLAFVKHVKATEYKFVPILMLTTEGQKETKEMGRSLGVRAWIVKPFQPNVLLDAVNKLCVAAVGA